MNNNLELDKTNINSMPWYCRNTEDLVNVTDQASNKNLGITYITVVDPTTEEKEKFGALARVNVDTTTGTFLNILILPAKNIGLRVQLPSRRIAINGRKSFTCDFTIKPSVKAQVLRYVASKLKKKAM